MFRLVLSASACFAALSASSTTAADLKAFLAAHCVDCHGPDEQKAHLRLDALGTDLAQDDVLDQWVRIYDKVAAGQMPPPDSVQPPQAEATAFTKQLHDELHAASLALQQSQGRVLLRRLNATEYENTLRSLVGTEVRVKEMLPEEKAVDGFDNVADALDFSATHQLLFQEAAEKAIRSAVPQYPDYPISDRRTGKDFSERGPNFKQTLNRSCMLDGDSLVIYSKLPRYGLCQTDAVRGAGTYRVRVSMAAVGAEQKPVPVVFSVLEGSGPDEPVLRELLDVQPGKSQVVEYEVFLDRRQAFVVNVNFKWDIRNTKEPIEAYTGPGVKLDWIEIEGPIGEFPPASYKKLFGDLPLKAGRSFPQKGPTRVCRRSTIAAMPIVGLTTRWNRFPPIRKSIPSG